MAVDNANKIRPKSLVSFAISTAILTMASTVVVQASVLQNNLNDKLLSNFLSSENAALTNAIQPQIASAGNSAASGGADSTEVYVLNHLEAQALATGNTQLLALIAAADTDEKAAKLAGELTPDRSGANIYNVMMAQDLFTQSIRKRTSDFLLGDSARSSMWASYLGSDSTSYVTSDGANRYDGFDASSTGFVIGYDQVLSKNTTLGVAFSHQNIDSEGRMYDNDLEVESYQASIYGTQTLDDYYLSGRGVVGWNSNTANRSIGSELMTGQKTNTQSRYNSYNFAVEVDLIRPFYWHDFSILPLLSAGYTHIRAEGYSENGSGSAAALAYEQQNYQELTLGLGLEVAHSLYTKIGAFQTRAGIRSDFEVLDMDLTTTATLLSGGDSFTVGINENEDVRYESYVDLTWETNGSMTWSLGVQHNWDSSTENNLLYGRAVYSF
ncbi:MAG: autotransporter outer membrane beta-barrel domain-containing protein [Moritella sp.]|uniref:autotransporter outer membrane beta-barrel domain-containing protein n=1 Tax=Moritella sp. TaxID=78556 RepID=UPI0029BA3CBA|nr:autotransporter outer membrane beta-barrel domain-containing protein [Moritella sp.]MDX2321681.1 autotransporter outer membrane beta-barrel domain-containing protein [Moritella sp.]